MASILENTCFHQTIDLILSFVDDLLSGMNIKQPLFSKIKEKWDSFSNFLRKKRPINLLHIQAFLQTKFHAQLFEETPQNLLKNDSFTNKTKEIASMKTQEISPIHINLPYSYDVSTFKMKNTLDQWSPSKKNPSFETPTKKEFNVPIKTEISLNKWSSSVKNTRTEPNENEKNFNEKDEKSFFITENEKKFSFSDKKPFYFNSIQENQYQNSQINMKKINLNMSQSPEKPHIANSYIKFRESLGGKLTKVLDFSLKFLK